MLDRNRDWKIGGDDEKQAEEEVPVEEPEDDPEPEDGGLCRTFSLTLKKKRWSGSNLMDKRAC